MRTLFGLLRTRIHHLVSQWAVLYQWQHNSRRNVIEALRFMLLCAPIALIVFVLLVLRRLIRRPLKMKILATDGEFGHLVELLEYLRREFSEREESLIVITLSRWRHSGLANLYGSEFNWSFIWSAGICKLWQQVLMLQPPLTANLERHSRITIQRGFCESPIKIGENLRSLSASTLSKLGCGDTRFVALSVFSVQYEVQRTPAQASKTRLLETNGSLLKDAIDLIKNSGREVIVVGALDHGKSHIPRKIPRLGDFVPLGDEREIALASQCDYFWTDGVGGWWLTVPMQRPVLFTNQYELRQNVGAWPAKHLVLPTRWITKDGRELSLDEILMSSQKVYKRALAGELTMIRNSASEISAANAEMLARLRGSWIETQDRKELVERSMIVFPDIPDFSR